MEKNVKKKEKQNKVGQAIKNFFNRPTPLIIVLICLCAFLTLYIYNYNAKNRIFIGEVIEENLQIVNVHYFTNGDMNYFYASPALYIGEDKKIYSFQMGYYVVDKNGNYIELATRARELEKKDSLASITEEMSAWNFAEPDKGEHFFTKEVMENLDSLRFVIKATTKKDTTEADFVIDYPVKMTKLTK